MKICACGNEMATMNEEYGPWDEPMCLSCWLDEPELYLEARKRVVCAARDARMYGEDMGNVHGSIKYDMYSWLQRQNVDIEDMSKNDWRTDHWDTQTRRDMLRDKKLWTKMDPMIERLWKRAMNIVDKRKKEKNNAGQSGSTRTIA